jgi:lon-related putative ATP-dependent protease
MPDDRRRVDPDQLYQRSDLGALAFDTTDDLEPFEGLLGQERAADALALGLAIDGDGFNIFVHGPDATDKDSPVRRMLRERAAAEPPGSDWCYVNCFDEPNKPRYLRLPAGRGAQLKHDLDAFASELRGVIAGAFESEEYQTRRQTLEQASEQEQDAALESVQEKARENDLRLVRTPLGFLFAPVKEGEVVSPRDLGEFPPEEQQRIQAAVEELQEELQQVLRQVPGRHRRLRKAVHELDREFAELVVRDLMRDLRAGYADQPEVLAHFDAVQADVVENARSLVEGSEESGPIRMLKVQHGGEILDRYRANVLVSAEPEDGAPLVTEDNPNFQNLVGRVDYQSQFGALTTSFDLIRPGALHKANGGYLVLDARKVLTQPYAWEALKRALASREIVVESPGQALGLLSTTTLEPQPIPLEVKVVLLGERILYYLLESHDPEFGELFKVQADFRDALDRTPEHEASFARQVARLARTHDLRPITRPAVERVIEHAARLVGDGTKLSAESRHVADLLREADHLARQRGDGSVSRDDVDRAVHARIRRADRLREELQENILRGTLRIDTDGARVGQVNGLSVVRLDAFSFGRPSRITARTRLGEGEIIDIEREVELGGPLHSKGVMILSGFLKARYATETPLSLSASLVFEQSYGGIEGDSASSAELYALMSAIADAPLRQDLAVTGSVNQLGEVQAIGGVNEKVEGFFDVCAARGLTGNQGVIVPAANLTHLMLDARVVDACRQGRFHLYAVNDVDEGMELLTGLPMGERDDAGAYAEGSINARVEASLQRLARLRRAFVRKEEDDA